MEALKIQQTCFENIKTLCRNYKKDGGSRKTEAYLVEKLNDLETRWMDFNNRHSELLGTADQDISYFSENIFEKTKNLYDAIKSDISQRLQLIKREEISKIYFDTSNIFESISDPRLEILMAKQTANVKAIERAMSKIDITTLKERWELEDHFNILKTKWESVDKLHWEIETLNNGTDEQYSDMFLRIEQRYDELRKALRSKIQESMHYQHSSPRIELPEFNGDYKQWISFKDLFMETIHINPTINKAQKMKHLKSKLRGEAENIVKHLPICADKYDSCWSLLLQRYDNNHIQFVTYMNNMMRLPLIQNPNAFIIKRMHDVINETMNGIANIGIDTNTWDPIIVYLMTQKLDTATYGDYLKSIQDQRQQHRLSDFMNFLEGRFLAYEAKKTTHKEDVPSKPKQHPLEKQGQYKKNVQYTSKAYHATYGLCPYCNESHVLIACPKFLALDIKQRNNLARKLNVCKNCLFAHDTECKSSKTCKYCNMKHHSLLHYTNKNATQNEVSRFTQPNTSTQGANSNHIATSSTETLLTTFVVNVKTIDGSYIKLRGLLDQGSQVNLITERAAQLLRLPRKKMTISISGVGPISENCKGRIELMCGSIHSEYSFNTEVLIMNKITKNLPETSFQAVDCPHLKNLKLADPDYNISQQIDLLFGADVYSEIILDGVLKGNQQSPTAQHTQIGWILCGKLNYSTVNCHVTLIDLTQMTKFWESENITTPPEATKMDEECENFYKNTVTRGKDGKYIVRMPLKTDYETKLGYSRGIAVSQFLQLEKRFARNQQLAKMYREFILEYQQLGHMKPAINYAGLQCFLPHHGVIRESSSTTKLRTVFNASQKTSSGYSLNDVLEKGENLQKDIQELILKWRSYKYAFTADIEKMYRNFWQAEDQQQLQKIIWRDSPTEDLQEFQLCTLTYGTKSAPWLAMRTLRQLAMDDGHLYPDAAKILSSEFFMDDLISGHNSLEEAEVLQKSLINILKSAGLNLRKWTSNHPKLLEHLQPDQISGTNNFDFKAEESTKTLGLCWNPKTDVFNFNWSAQKFKNNTKSKTITKRELLSQISKLYDPLGWMSPITIKAKLIFQKVWLNNLRWDEELSPEIYKEWIKMTEQLHLINNINLKRWIGSNEKDIELLAFSDASQNAYASVVYCRAKDESGCTVITLLAAKTRVAPVAQKITLPRLELAGAKLLSELVTKIKYALKTYNITIHAWSDSQVVLAWIQGEPTKWDTYVSNRVRKIREVIPANRWNYIKSEDNPADCATRGLYPKQMIDHIQWWTGPRFLKSFQITRITDNNQELKCLFTTNLETKIKDKDCKIKQTSDYEIINSLLHKHSSLTRTIRVLAWIKRFINNYVYVKARATMKFNTSYLSTDELIMANEQLICFVQESYFYNDYKQIMNKETLSRKSLLYKLNAYIEERGKLLRVGGRLKNSALPSGMKNPIILPKEGRYTQLLIETAHKATMHGGACLTSMYLRQKYWITGGNKLVKSLLRNCVRCHRFRQHNTEQLMGNLPAQRITPSRPFTHTGVDFTGYLDVKLNRGRGVKTTKGYAALFVCLASKAVHIELVSDLSSDAFLAAFQRLCARRGVPKHMYSDNGTNFVGGARKLSEDFKEYKQILNDHFFDNINQMEVQWHFNVASWPSGGGIWEAGIRSLKHFLKRVLGEQKLTFEQLSTVLARAEACMNSRPICPLTETPDDFYNCLTPGHFLTGSPLLSPPSADCTDIKSIDIRSRWQLTEHMAQRFWKLWSNDYLHHLQTRAKWNKPTTNIEKGDIVLIMEDNLPPGKWAMGKIQDVHPGADGLVRVTTVKTKTSILKRPIVKLAPLPINTEIQDLKNNLTKESENKETETRKPAKRNYVRKQAYVINLITILLLLITGACCERDTLSSSIHVTNIEPGRPAYYDMIGKLQLIHDDWALVMYYNLTNYWSGVQRLQTFLNETDDQCKKSETRFCQTTIKQLFHEMEIIAYYNDILLEPTQHLSKRKKRGLVDGVGYVANSLFGILDSRFAEKYQNDIQAVQTNENYLLELIKNQTSIIELQNTVLKKSEQHIQEQFDHLDTFVIQTRNNFLKVEESIGVAMSTGYFSMMSLSAYILINNLKNVQEMLFNTLTDVYKGHIDVHLITPTNLIRQLRDIQGKIPNRLSLPIGDYEHDIKDIYKLLQVRARVTNNFFIFEIHIPLISDEELTLYKVIPLPIKKNDDWISIIIQSKYIATNLKKHTYISLTEDISKTCTSQKQGTYVCKNNLPFKSLSSSQATCEARLLSQSTIRPCDVRHTTCKEEWIELHTTNSWLAICCGTCIIRVICDNSISAITLKSPQIITIAQGCVLQSNDFTIFARNQYSSKAKTDYELSIPTMNTQINNIVNVTYHNTPFVLSDTSEMNKLQLLLKQQKEKESKLPVSINTHDIHQYAVSYSGLTLIVVLGLAWFGRKCCACKRPAQTLTTANTTVVREEIQLHHLPQRRGDTRRKEDSLHGIDNDVSFKFDDDVH